VQEKFRAPVSQDVVLVRGILFVGAVRHIEYRSLVANLVGEGGVRYQRRLAQALPASRTLVRPWSAVYANAPPASM